MNLELTPVYSVEPVGPFADMVYQKLVAMLDGQVQGKSYAAYIERVSVPGVLSGQSVRLFSGQEVSQFLVDATRGMYGWTTTTLIENAINAVKQVEELAAAEEAEAAQAAGEQPEETKPLKRSELRRLLRQVLNKLYYQYRNLGITSPDRALNFAATNIFQLATVLARAIIDKKSLDRIDVAKSAYCRIDSDCWDVMLKFLDPENTNRAYAVWRFSVDVSDKMPVTLDDFVEYTSST